MNRKGQNFSTSLRAQAYELGASFKCLSLRSCEKRMETIYECLKKFLMLKNAVLRKKKMGTVISK